ncbi:MAG: V-type ATPase subunit [Burkholderiales bacterium]
MSERNSTYPFASARVKSMENRMLTQEKLARILEAKDFEDAMRSLQELGYGSSVSGKASFEQLIEQELKEADDLLEFLSPSDLFIKIMRAGRDYHNLKVLIKLSMLGRDLDGAGLTPGNISVETLKRAVSENNYSDLTPVMKDALGAIDKQFAVAADVSVVGSMLDRAYSKEVSELVRELGNELVSRYFTAYFDLSNIIAFMRVRAFYGRDSFDNAFLEGGSIDKKTFIDAFELSDENVLSAVVKGEYARVLSGAVEDYIKTKSLYMLEKARDDYLLSLVKEQRHDMFGIGPLMGYYIGKQREAAAVRMVMTAKQGGVDSEVVQKRLKEIY